MTAPFKPVTNYSNIVDRLRRAFGLVGDVDIVPDPRLSNIVNVADLTTPGHATFRGRLFSESFQSNPAAAAYMAWRASETVVITSLWAQADSAVTLTYRLMPNGMADGATWSYNTQIPFVERVVSVNDLAPLARLGGVNVNPPPVLGVSFAVGRPLTNLTPLEALRGSAIVLTPGDRITVLASAAITNGLWGISGYVF